MINLPPTLTAFAITTAAAVTTLTVALLFRRRSKAVTRRLRSSTIGSTRFMVAGTTGLREYDTIINICLNFDVLPEMTRFKTEWAEVVLPYLRFRAVPQQTRPLGPITWVLQNVDMNRHFMDHSVANIDVARTVIDTLSNDLLADKEQRPWWEVHFVSVAGSPGGFVLLRIHHAIGDGISLAEALAPLMRNAAGDRVDLSKNFNPHHDATRKKSSSSVAAACGALFYAASFVSHCCRIVALTVLRGDAPNRFCREQWPYSGRRITVYMPSHSLDTIKEIKRRLGSGVTVNDVEFALFGGMVRRFLLAHDSCGTSALLRHCSMRALTPIAPVEHCDPLTKYSTLLRNVFTFVVNDIPVGQSSPLERVNAAHRSWARLKSSAAIPAAFFVHRISSVLPLSMQRKTLRDLMVRTSVVFSNVPGPQHAVYVAGCEVKAVHMIYPNLTPQVGILSLNGQIHTCISMAPDPTELDLRTLLPAYFCEELRALAEAVGVNPGL